MEVEPKVHKVHKEDKGLKELKVEVEPKVLKVEVEDKGLKELKVLQVM